MKHVYIGLMLFIGILIGAVMPTIFAGEPTRDVLLGVVIGDPLALAAIAGLWYGIAKSTKAPKAPQPQAAKEDVK